jgi:ABC-2 type transport system ATP-binding protein
MNTTHPYVVETKNLTKRFGDRVAVNGVDLRIPAGSAFGYLGPNGAGKTTLIRMLLGLTSVSSGEVSILGHSTRPAAPRRWRASAQSSRSPASTTT